MRSIRLLIGVLGVFLLGCTPEYRTNFPQLKEGMSKTEVRELLGAPSVEVAPRRDSDGAIIQGARWQYGDNLSTWTTSAVFSETEPDRVWIVWFDQEGLLSGSRAPNWMDGQGDNQSQPVRRDIFEPMTPSRFK